MTSKSLDELKSAFNMLLDIPNVEVDEIEIEALLELPGCKFCLKTEYCRS